MRLKELCCECLEALSSQSVVCLDLIVCGFSWQWSFCIHGFCLCLFFSSRSGPSTQLTQHEPGHELAHAAPGHSLPSALQHVQPTGVSDTYCASFVWHSCTHFFFFFVSASTNIHWTGVLEKGAFSSVSEWYTSCCYSIKDRFCSWNETTNRHLTLQCGILPYSE